MTTIFLPFKAVFGIVLNLSNECMNNYGFKLLPLKLLSVQNHSTIVFEF